MSLVKSVKWQLVFVASLGSVVFLLAAVTVFVVFYAQFIEPGKEQAFYNQFALDTSAPFLFCFSPFFMYIVSRWLCGKASRAYYLHALLYLLIYYLLDTSLIVFSPGMLQQWLHEFFSFKHLLIVAAQLSGVLVGAYLAKKQSLRSN